MRRWLLAWLGGASLTEVELSRVANNQVLRDGFMTAMINMKADYEAQIAELIQELNALRNAVPVAVQDRNTRPVRVYRNFREFRTAVEGKPQESIRIERTS